MSPATFECTPYSTISILNLVKALDIVQPHIYCQKLRTRLEALLIRGCRLVFSTSLICNSLAVVVDGTSRSRSAAYAAAIIAAKPCHSSILCVSE